MTDATDISVGSSDYVLRHCRFGTATVRIKAIEPPWIDVVVKHGELRGIGAGARWLPGDEKRVRVEHCHFSPVSDD